MESTSNVRVRSRSRNADRVLSGRQGLDDSHAWAKGSSEPAKLDALNKMLGEPEARIACAAKITKDTVRAGAPVASEASGIAFTKETGGALNKSHSSVAMIGDLDAMITETENEIQACISKREFNSLESLEVRKRELQCQKRDMELCGDKKAFAAGTDCGLLGVSEKAVSVEVAEMDARIVALDMAIDRCVRERKFSGLVALEEEKQKLVKEIEKLKSQVPVKGRVTTRGGIEPGVTCNEVDAREADIVAKVAELDERIVAVDMAIEKNIRNRKYSGLEALDEEKQKLVEETNKLKSQVPVRRETFGRSAHETGATGNGVGGSQATVAV